jgi:hypothetical protein
VDWAAAEELAIAANDLEKSPADAEYAPCAPAASQVKNYAAWAKDFTTWIQNDRTLTLFRSPSLGLVSKPGEEERDFRIRLQQTAREGRDAAAEQSSCKISNGNQMPFQRPKLSRQYCQLPYLVLQTPCSHFSRGTDHFIGGIWSSTKARNALRL